MNNEIEILRRNVRSFINNIILPQTENKIVLEIGPAIEKYTPLKEFFIDTRKELEDRGNQYLTCDIDPDSGADFICDFTKIEKFGFFETFDTIIALEVLEHTQDIWNVPSLLARLLKPGGKIYISTPFYFLWHDPRPDLWRISEDGLRYLFEPFFDIQIEAKGDPKDDGRHPIHHTLIGIKK